jgi:YVTN family beta-propeller protein
MRGVHRFVLAAPLALALLAVGAPHRTLVVANQGAGTISVVDLDGGAPVAPMRAPAAPHEVAIDEGASRAAVSDYGDQTGAGHAITLLDLRGGAQREIDLGTYTRPHGMVWLDAQRLAVTSESTQSLVVVDANAGRVLSAIPTHGRGSHMVVRAPDGRRAYVVNVGDGTLSVLDLGAAAFVTAIRTGNGSEGVAIAPNGREVWVANRADETISVVDTAANAVVATLPAPGLPYRVAFAPDGTKAYVACVLADRLRVYDAAARREERAIELPRPTGFTLSRDGGTAYVAHGEGAGIRVVDLATGRVVRSIETGTRPDGVGVAEPRPT